MAARARDPTLHEFAVLTATEEAATAFAQQRGLLLSANALAQRQRQQAKSYEGFRCSQCKKFRSAKNAVDAGEIRGAAPNQQELDHFCYHISKRSITHTHEVVDSNRVVSHIFVVERTIYGGGKTHP
jgi:hypothetical protein